MIKWIPYSEGYTIFYLHKFLNLKFEDTRRSIVANQRVHTKGFTLIEVLVAITLFAIVVSISSYSFRYFVNIFNFVDDPYNREFIKRIELLNSLSGITYYSVKNDDAFGENIKYKNFIIGDRESFKYITNSPFLINYDCVVAKLQIKTGNLIYSEAPLYSYEYDYAKPDTIDNFTEITIDSNINNFAVEYDTDNGIRNTVSDMIQSITISYQKDEEKYTLTSQVFENFNRSQYMEYVNEFRQ